MVLRGEFGATGNRQGVVRLINFGTYNIRNGWNRALESALLIISMANMGLGVFQYTKVTKCIYTRESSEFRVVETEIPSVHSSGVAVFYRAAEHFSMEALHTYRANIVRFQLESGGRRWFIVG